MGVGWGVCDPLSPGPGPGVLTALSPPCFFLLHRLLSLSRETSSVGAFKVSVPSVAAWSGKTGLRLPWDCRDRPRNGGKVNRAGPCGIRGSRLAI